MKRNAWMLALVLAAGAALLAAPAWAAEPTTAPAAPAAAPPPAPAPAPAPAADRDACNCIFCKAKQEQQSITPWLKVSADLRLREIYAPNLIYFDKDRDDSDWHFQRYRARLGWTVTPCKDLDFNFRLVYEPRHYCFPKDRDDPAINEAIFDLFNVTYRNVCGLPVTAVVGRQEIILGDGWLVLDGTPLDGSRTIFFDAVRVTTEMKDIQSKLDLIYLNQHADSDRWIDPFCDKDYHNIESNEQGVIAYFTNKSCPKTELNAFYMYKHEDRVLSAGRNSDIHTLGARVVHNCDDNWQVKGQIAPQFGWTDGENLCALGATTRLTYKFNDPHKNEVHTGYEFLSGDNPNTKTVERFDILWGRWPQWSEGYGIYGVIPETGGRPGDLNNLHRFNVLGWSGKPCEQITLGADYNVVFAQHNNMSSSTGYTQEGDTKGSLLTGRLIYRFNKHVSGHVWAELFFPGNFYDKSRNDVEGFFRYQLEITW